MTDSTSSALPESPRYVVRQGALFHGIAIIIGLVLLAGILWADPRRTAIAILQVRAEFGPWDGLVLVALYASATIIHEMSHGAAGRWVGGGPVRYGTRIVLRVIPLAFWCALEGVMSRVGVVAVLLAPQAVVAAALAALALVAPGAWGACWLIYVLMVIGSASDFLMVVAILGSRARRVRDSASGVLDASDAIGG